MKPVETFSGWGQCFDTVGWVTGRAASLQKPGSLVSVGALPIQVEDKNRKGTDESSFTSYTADEMEELS